MDIGPLSNERPGPPSAGDKGAGKKPVAEGLKPRDIVEISEDARRKLAELADAALRAQRIEQTNHQQIGDAGGKVEQIRRRIETGFYDRSEVKRKIVDRLIDDMEA